MAQPPLSILILGGSGFVSGTLCRTALELGHQVTILTRGQKPIPPGVMQLTADRHDGDTFTQIIRKQNKHWDLVVDCIGYEPQDAAQDIAVFKDCTDQCVFISTDFVFDPERRTFPQRDDNPHYTTFGYGGQKRLCELEFLNTDTGPMRWTILRPCHIYGPGSLLGCLPAHGRDPKLLDTLKAGQPLALIGGGRFLQQPILAADLARIILSCQGQPQAHRQTFITYGPDIIESREYYRILAERLGVPLHIKELPVSGYLRAHPDGVPFCCHRIAMHDKLRDYNLYIPTTPIADGLTQHLQSLLAASDK